jgi:hypothetical protein
VLAKDLEAIAARDGDDVARVCKLVRANYGYPVDSVLIGADLRVHGHVNVHEPRGRDPAAYLAFLRTGLAAAGRVAAAPGRVSAAGAVGDAGEADAEVATARRPLQVTPERPTASLLDVFRARGFGRPSMVFTMIDATAFVDGGVLEIGIRTGSGSAAGRFELCAAAPEGGEGAALMMQPVEAKSVARESTATLAHEFASGGSFGLAVAPVAGTPQAGANAFVATITVRKR